MAEVIMPKMGDAMEEGTLLEWKRQDGETVKVGDIIAEIETDKSNVEVEAEDAGVLHLQAEPGAVVPVGTVIATIGDVKPGTKAEVGAKPGQKQAGRGDLAPTDHAVTTPVGAGSPRPDAVSRSASAPPTPISAPPRSTNGSGSQERVKASPLARRIAREQGFDIAQITGTGPNGRIIEADVLAFQPKSASKQLAVAEPMPATPPVELTAMRKVIARRMVESKTSVPHFYITSEIDMAESLALREKLNSYDESLVKISLNDMIVKASALALAKVPAVNAVFRDDKIYPGSGIHVGIAVALEDGLIVPVVRDADTLPLRKLAQTGKTLIQKARDKKLQPNEYSGGTFTVSNLGGFDVENFIAIIDPAQGAILAVSSIVKKAVVLEDDTIAVRPRLNVTFSGDHRVMDGATGAKFLQELKRLLQNPLSLLE